MENKGKLIPPTLAVYDVAHSLPLGGAGRGFPFTEDETRSISHTSGTFTNFMSYGIRRFNAVFTKALQ